MVIIPVAFAAVVVTIWLGGPGNALLVLERLTYDVLDSLRVLLRS